MIHQIIIPLSTLIAIKEWYVYFIGYIRKMLPLVGLNIMQTQSLNNLDYSK